MGWWGSWMSEVWGRGMCSRTSGWPLLLWKGDFGTWSYSTPVITDVATCNKEAAAFVWEQRREHFQVLLKSLKTMRHLPPSCENDDEIDRRQMMSCMIALEENRLPWAECSDAATTTISPRRHLQQRKGWEEDFDVVFDLVEDSLTAEDEVETYWICRNLYKMMTQRRSLLQAQVRLYFLI